MSKATERIYGFFEQFWQKNQTVIAILALIFLFLVIFFWNNIAVSVYAGQQGVLWNRFTGTVVSTAYDEGMHFILPWNEMTIYNLRVAERGDTITALTVDGMEMNISYSILYRPLKKELGYIHRAVGPAFYTNLIHPMSVSAIRQVIGTLRTEQIIAMPEDSLLDLIQNTIHSNQFRFQYEDDAAGEIRVSDSLHILPHSLDPDNHQLIVEDLVNLFQVDVKIHSLALPPQVQAAINEKLVHEQSEESYAFRLSAETKEKERKRIEAEGIRDFESIAGISILQWRGIEATEKLSESPNSKIVIIGTDGNELPVLLNGEGTR